MNRPLRKLQDQRRLRPMAQFSLRTLMLMMALCAISIWSLQEITQRYGLLASLACILAALSIFAHLAGAAIGNHFRRMDRKLDASDVENTSSTIVHRQPLVASKNDFVPPTELSRQQPLVLKPIYWAIGIGALSSAILASIILTLYLWDDLAIVNVLFGAVSAAVIGGLMGFAISSFLQVVRSALADAEKNT